MMLFGNAVHPPGSRDALRRTGIILVAWFNHLRGSGVISEAGTPTTGKVIPGVILGCINNKLEICARHGNDIACINTHVYSVCPYLTPTLK